MQKRQFGKAGFDVSALGFGIMRLPVIDRNPAKIDEEKAVPMLCYAIESGVNYIDAAYIYHGEQSEVFVGKVLKEHGYRDKVKIATKSPVWMAKKHQDFDDFLNEELERLQTDHIDLYLLHALSRKSWDAARELRVLEFIDRALADGRIGYAGFSFHDSLDTFKEIIGAYDWTFCQIQYNYLDERFQAGVEGLRYGADKGLAVVIMEPLRGGRLTKRVPAEVQQIWAQASVERSPAEWGLRWVWNHPEVTTVLSGMSAMEHVVENVSTARDAFPNSLTREELALIDQAKAFYMEKIKVHCTECNYCASCPQGIDIPTLFRMYNDAAVFVPGERVARVYYNKVMARQKPATECVECGQCEDVCPQGLEIPRYLQDLHDYFTGFENL